ncbi:MAG TPA: hypothetical protein DD670_06430 [Planctomycetaceae bacterium]|nr:hypothetical protein [Planctomycetaceae bacterium]
MVQNALIPLGMGQNADEPRASHVPQQIIQGNVHFVRQLEQNIPAVVSQRQNLALADPVDQIGLHPDLGPRQHVQGNVVLVEKFAKMGRLGSDRWAVELAVRAQLMRRNDRRTDAVGDCGSCHCQGFIPRRRAVVHARQHVAVCVDEGLANGHDGSSTARRRAVAGRRRFFDIAATPGGIALRGPRAVGVGCSSARIHRVAAFRRPMGSGDLSLAVVLAKCFCATDGRVGASDGRRVTGGSRSWPHVKNQGT